ncbi:MAG: histidine phosphatase family protein [Alkaliphilus sp.]|nr:histidine phosphatase family protein [Alkaliphilus sp.]
MTRLYLVRHGETKWNAEFRAQGSKNVELSDTGRKQAYLLADRMHSYGINKIISSNLDRAYETGEILGAKLNLKVEKLEDLKEMNFGVWEGLTMNEIQSKYSEHYTIWRNKPHDAEIPDGERLIHVQKRGLDSINKIIKTNPEQNIVVVSHGTMIKAIILGILDIDLSYFYKIRQDNTCINVIDYKSYGPVVVTLNDIAHLDKMSRS